MHGLSQKMRKTKASWCFVIQYYLVLLVVKSGGVESFCGEEGEEAFVIFFAIS